MICRISGATLMALKLIIIIKVTMFENKRGPKKRKRKIHFVSWKAFFFFLVISSSDF